MYAFGTSHSRHTFTFDQFLLSLEIKPKTFVLLTPCSTVTSIWCEVQFMEVKKNLQGKMKWKDSFSQSFWRLVCFVDDVLDRVAYYWACVCTRVCVCVCVCSFRANHVFLLLLCLFLSLDPSVLVPPLSISVNFTTSPGWLILEYLNQPATLA